MGIFDWKKKLYISKYSGKDTRNGYEYEEYSEPIMFYENYQPLSATFKRQEYGDSVGSIYRAYFDTSKYQGTIHVGDLAYLIDGEIDDVDVLVTSEDVEENGYGVNANYKVKAVLVQNLKIKVDFEKITKDSSDI